MAESWRGGKDTTTATREGHDFSRAADELSL